MSDIILNRAYPLCVIKRGKIFLLSMGAVSLLLLALGGAFFYYEPFAMVPYYKWIGVIVCLCGLVVLQHAKKTASKPLISLFHEGVMLDIVLCRKPLIIPWDGIKEISNNTIMNSLVIEVTDRYAKKMPRFLKGVKVQRMYGKELKAFYLIFAGLSVPIATAVERIAAIKKRNSDCPGSVG